MKNIIILFLFSIIINGCVNSISDDEGTELNDVTFTVNFEKEIINIDNSRAAVNGVKYIDCFFLSDGNLVHEIHQTIEDADFGTLKAKFSNGNYSVYIIGHNSSVINFNESLMEIKPDKVSDTFFNSSDITITGNLNKSFTLNRSVGKIEIVALDGIPDNAKMIKLSLSKSFETFDLAKGIGKNQSSQVIREWTYNSNNIGQTNTTYSIYSFVPESYGELGNLKIEVFDSNNNIIATHQIDDVEFVLNKIQRYSGNLFSKEFDSDITMDTEWDEIIENHF